MLIDYLIDKSQQRDKDCDNKLLPFSRVSSKIEKPIEKTDIYEFQPRVGESRMNKMLKVLSQENQQ